MYAYLDGDGELAATAVAIESESTSRLAHHLAHELAAVDESRAHAFLDGPFLRTTAVQLHTVAFGAHELRRCGELVRCVRRELND